MPLGVFVSLSETRNAGPAQLGIIALGFQCGLFRAGMGEGQREEAVSAEWRQGTAGVPLREQLPQSLLSGYTAKWCLLILFKG